MSNDSALKKSFTRNLSLWLGVLFVFCAFLFYGLNFGGWDFWRHLSHSRELWGQFGDFMGGLLNPLLGLLTIWLITKSLHQNSEMLAAAREELELARQEIARGVQVQRDTEVALKQQIEIARHGKDFNAALSLQNNYADMLDAHSHNKIHLKASDVDQYERRNLFLRRYIDFQFDYFIEQAIEAGIDPIKEFGTFEYSCGGARFLLTAFAESRWTLISYIDPVGGPERFCYWVDQDSETRKMKSHLSKINFLIEGAKAAVENLMAIDPEKRRASIEQIPGLFLTVPNKTD